MNALELLKKQHSEVNDLFGQFERANRSAEKEKIFLDIASRLVSHDAIEREIFYPACEKALGDDEDLIEGIAEHGIIEFSIFRADKARKADRFDILVKVFQEMVEHHVEEEEKTLFPKVKKAVDEQVLEALGEEMEARFKKAMSTDFRRALRRNLEQVIAGRVRTNATKRPRASAAKTRRAPATSRAHAKPKAKRSQGSRGR